MKILLAIILLLKLTIAKAQEPDPVFAIYEEQYTRLLQLRGVPESAIGDLLKNYSTGNINSDTGLVHVLQQLYSTQRDIGVLFYFFNNDTLRRAYYKPGKVIEVSYIPIKKDFLMQLGTDINESLKLYKLSENRAPTMRGNIILEKQTKKISFITAIKNATKILIPASFDTATKHLLIIPALNIGTIPFHLLQPFKNNDFLIDRCSFTIVPSLIDLVGLRLKILKKNSRNWPGIELPESFDGYENFSWIDKNNFELKKVLFVSNPAYPLDGAFIFPDLPGAEKEINSAKKYAKEYILLRGNKAIKDSVLKYIDKTNVVYFATHGIADQVDPMGKSFLVLSGKSPYLTAKEIMDMRSTHDSLPEMVILSACQTGLGKSMEAGTAGLARSFLLGGSSHVIMSLWSVDDDATAYLMSRFIYHLQTPHRFMPAEPLRLAILDTKIRYKKPAQWASFSLFGIDY